MKGQDDQREWARLSSSWRRLWRWEPFRRGLKLYLAVRIGLSVWALLVLVLVPADLAPDPVQRPYLGNEPLDSGLAGWLLGPWQRFDTLHFIRVAREGYREDSVVLPLYPLLIRTVGELLGGSAAGYQAAALLISNAACLGYLVALLALAQAEVGQKTAHRAQLYAALHPWAFVLIAGYSEPLTLLLGTAALLASRRGYNCLAGLCGALAALTRLSGTLLLLPLLLQVLLRRSDGRLWPPRLAWLWPPRLDLFWPVLPGLAALGFQFWRWINGLPPSSELYATFMGHRLALPWEGFTNTLRLVCIGGAHPIDYLDFVAGLIFIALTVVGWLRLSPPYALYLTALLLLNISHTRVPHPMGSVGRHTLEMFPAFFVLAQIGERSPWLNRLILYPSLLLLLWLSGQFFIWGWAG